MLLLLTVQQNVVMFGIFLFLLGCSLTVLPLTYPFITSNFPVSIRALGTGIGTSIGRIGSAVAPVVLGFMLAAKWAPNQIFYFLCILPVIGIVAVSFTQKTKHTGLEDLDETAAK
jgi:AAHS family benzoate transporter-like MFS transporter